MAVSPQDSRDNASKKNKYDCKNLHSYRLPVSARIAVFSTLPKALKPPVFSTCSSDTRSSALNPNKCMWNSLEMEFVLEAQNLEVQSLRKKQNWSSCRHMLDEFDASKCKNNLTK